WDAVTGTARAVLTGHTGVVWAVVAFSGPGGRTLLATGGEDGTVRVWDAVTGTARAVLTGHTGVVWAVVAFSGPGGRTLLATGGSDGMVRVWDGDRSALILSVITAAPVRAIAATAPVFPTVANQPRPDTQLVIGGSAGLAVFDVL
ncbi:hypothetical protein AB0K60_34885, partial [Thermopolyspora sp. NPDC052614]